MQYLKHKVEGERLREGVTGGRLGTVLAQDPSELLRAVSVRLPLHAEVLLALRLGSAPRQTAGKKGWPLQTLRKRKGDNATHHIETLPVNGVG